MKYLERLAIQKPFGVLMQISPTGRYTTFLQGCPVFIDSQNILSALRRTGLWGKDPVLYRQKQLILDLQVVRLSRMCPNSVLGWHSKCVFQ
jgi:hypothetical protein